MSENPKVSVFIASYNHVLYLPECLDSILTQTYQDIEIIIVDDGSDDGSHELLTSYQQHFPDKLFYFWHPGHMNKGISATCNLAISKARGEYLAWIGSDDVWYPDKLEQQVSILNNHPEIGLVYSYAEYIDSSGNKTLGIYGEDVTKDENPLGRMIMFCHTPAMTVVFRRKCLDQVGLYEETLVYSDWDLMVRIFAHWKVAFIDRPLAKYRIHGQNVSQRNDPQLGLHRIIEVLYSLQERSSYIGGALLEPRNQGILNLELAFHLFCNENKEEAVMYLHHAFQVDPSLTSDAEFINSWFDRWMPAFYNTQHNHFGLWVLSHLPRIAQPILRDQLADLQLKKPQTKSFFVQQAIQRCQAQTEPFDPATIFDDYPVKSLFPKDWKKEVLKEIYPELMFKSFKNDDLSKTAFFWRKTIQFDPSWLRNRGVWAIGLKAFLGSRMKSLLGS